ncbi:MAG: LacI family DNA-binding transcriptional regulator, partial [Victivallales bacterium]
MKKTMKYSLDKISAELGIGKTTVSLILNGKARKYAISRALENKVKDFCRNAGYSINVHARRMLQKQSGNIGVLIPAYPYIRHNPDENPFSDDNVTEIIGGIAKTAHEHGCRFNVQTITPEISLEFLSEWVNSKEVDGIIHYGLVRKSLLKMIVEEKLPFIAIGEDPFIGIPTVSADEYSGSFQVTEHLIGKGHRDFLYLSGMKLSYVSKERIRGFCDALKRHGVAHVPDKSLCGDFEEIKAYEFIRKRLASGKMVETAIVCGNDSMAIGAIRALKEAGR